MAAFMVYRHFLSLPHGNLKHRQASCHSAFILPSVKLSRKGPNKPEDRRGECHQPLGTPAALPPVPGHAPARWCRAGHDPQPPCLGAFNLEPKQWWEIFPSWSGLDQTFPCNPGQLQLKDERSKFGNTLNHEHPVSLTNQKQGLLFEERSVLKTQIPSLPYSVCTSSVFLAKAVDILSSTAKSHWSLLLFLAPKVGVCPNRVIPGPWI